ncbi:unnamed protein product [Sympodiomycopsis kandeliae]
MAPPPTSSNASLPLGLYLTQKVLLLTQDGRILIGELQGFDTVGSIVLSHTIERIFTAKSNDEDDEQEGGVEEVELGLYVLRGDAIALIGDVDQTKESKIDWSTFDVDGIPPVRFS